MVCLLFTPMFISSFEHDPFATHIGVAKLVLEMYSVVHLCFLFFIFYFFFHVLCFHCRPNANRWFVGSLLFIIFFFLSVGSSVHP